MKTKTKEEWKEYRRERKIAKAAKKHQEFMRSNPDYANEQLSSRREKWSWEAITAILEDYRELMAKYIDAKQQIEKLQTERDALMTMMELD